MTGVVAAAEAGLGSGIEAHYTRSSSRAGWAVGGGAGQLVAGLGPGSTGESARGPGPGSSGVMSASPVGTHVRVRLTGGRC